MQQNCLTDHRSPDQQGSAESSQHPLLLSWSQWQLTADCYVSISEQSRLLEWALIDSTGLRQLGFQLDPRSLIDDSPHLCQHFVKVRLQNRQSKSSETPALAALQQFESYAIFAYKSSSNNPKPTSSPKLADSLAKLVADRCAACGISAIVRPWRHDQDGACCECLVCEDDGGFFSLASKFTFLAVTVDVLTVLRRLSEDSSSAKLRFHRDTRSVELLCPTRVRRRTELGDKVDALSSWLWPW